MYGELYIHFLSQALQQPWCIIRPHVNQDRQLQVGK
jgi:hypothetical protein